MFDHREFYKEENIRAIQAYEQNIKAVKAILLAPTPKYAKYIKTVGEFIVGTTQLEQNICDTYFKNTSFEELKAQNVREYSDITGDAYQTSFANPSVAVAAFGKQMGQALSFIYAQVLKLTAYAYQHRIAEMNRIVGLFANVTKVLSGKKAEDAVVQAIKTYTKAALKQRFEAEITQNYDKDNAYWREIIEQSDLTDLRYMFRFGYYVDKNEVAIAKYLQKQPQDKIDAMAKTMTDGYFRGFERANKPLDGKNYVVLYYPIGFERVVKAAIKYFGEKGLTVTFNRERTESTAPSKQFTYDHKFDQALYLDQVYVKKVLGAKKQANESKKQMLAEQSGVVWLESFGQTPFTPKSNDDALKLNEVQRKLEVNMSIAIDEIRNAYIDMEKWSFTIIAYPLPEIGEQFEAIFDDTIKVNTLDSDVYERIQQSIIDVADQGEKVHITGKGANQTDITVALTDLDDPSTQTKFENCIADVNIPVGEVFTSPKLSGTNGILHVTQVFLKGLLFKNLKLTFKDGFIKEYTCTNFKDDAQNKQYILDNIMHSHSTLPLGEFAIGTNTTAYAMANKYGIMHLLPILIVEKMGPHFAVGDTCFGWEEDVPVINPLNGKDMIARDNEMTLNRKTDVSKAYTNCHTDITIPYSELDSIDVLKANGEKVSIIADGRFVLKGTKALNTPLDA